MPRSFASSTELTPAHLYETPVWPEGKRQTAVNFSDNKVRQHRVMFYMKPTAYKNQARQGCGESKKGGEGSKEQEEEKNQDVRQ